MRELRPSGLPGPHQAGVYQRGQRLGRLAIFQPRHACRQRRPELDAEHARRVREAAIGAGTAKNSRQQNRRLVTAFVELVQAASLLKMARDLFEEKRIAAACRPRPTARLLRGLGAHALGEQSGGRRGAERHELLQLRLALLGEVAGEVESRPRPRPQRGHQGDRQRGQAVAQE